MPALVLEHVFHVWRLRGAKQGVRIDAVLIDKGSRQYRGKHPVRLVLFLLPFFVRIFVFTICRRLLEVDVVSIEKW